MGPEPAEAEITDGWRRDDRALAPTRWVSIGIVPVLCAAFVILFFFPNKTKELWAWTIHPTMTAMMMGGGYLAGAWFFFRAATTSEGHRVLKGLLGTTVFTSLLLAATLLHWDKFNHSHVSFWAWMLLYVTTPPLLPWLWFTNRKTDRGVMAEGDVAVPDPIRAVVFATDRRWSSFVIPMETATLGLALVLVATIRASDEFDGKAPGPTPLWSSERSPP